MEPFLRVPLGGRILSTIHDYQAAQQTSRTGVRHGSNGAVGHVAVGHDEGNPHERGGSFVFPASIAAFWIRVLYWVVRRPNSHLGIGHTLEVHRRDERGADERIRPFPAVARGHAEHRCVSLESVPHTQPLRHVRW